MKTNCWFTQCAQFPITELDSDTTDAQLLPSAGLAKGSEGEVITVVQVKTGTQVSSHPSFKARALINPEFGCIWIFLTSWDGAVYRESL